MGKLTKVTTITAILFLLAGGVTWLCGQYVLHEYRSGIFKVPIRLEPGFALTRQFTVDVPAKYYLGIRFHKRTLIRNDAPDDFSVEFTITSRGTVVAAGNSGNDRHGRILGPFSTTRLLEPFEAEPGAPYDLSLKVTDASPAIASTNPTLMLGIDPLFTQDSYIKGLLLIYLGVGLAFFGGIIVALQLSRLRKQKKVLYTVIFVSGFLLIVLIVPILTVWYAPIAIGLLFILGRKESWAGST